jgi:hypothetical protein
VCEEVDGQGTVEIREAFDKGNIAQKMNAVSYLNYKMVTVKQAKVDVSLAESVASEVNLVRFSTLAVYCTHT